MKCPNCGVFNKDSAKFCKSCGSSLNQENLAYQDKFGSQVNNSSVKSDSLKNSKNTLIICITVIVCAIIVVGALVYLNSNSDDSASVNVDDNAVTADVSNDNNVNSGANVESSNTVTISGNSFNLPSQSTKKDKYFYGFTFNGQECEIGLTEHYEEDTPTKTFTYPTLSQNYQGGEAYELDTSDNHWIGIKVGKGGKCYCIAMSTYDLGSAEELFAWMSNHNSWSRP